MRWATAGPSAKWVVGFWRRWEHITSYGYREGIDCARRQLICFQLVELNVQLEQLGNDIDEDMSRCAETVRTTATQPGRDLHAHDNQGVSCPIHEGGCEGSASRSQESPSSHTLLADHQCMR